jgi:hypothetical protein
MKIKVVAKAIVAGVVTFCGSLATALASTPSDGVTAQEWLSIIPLTVVAMGAVYVVPNAQPGDK